MGFLSDGYFWLGLVAGVVLGVWLLSRTREYKAFQAHEMQKQIERERALIYDDDLL
jgi:hypothetical protein